MAKCWEKNRQRQLKYTVICVYVLVRVVQSNGEGGGSGGLGKKLPDGSVLTGGLPRLMIMKN